jgi:hypothetical protein
MELFYDINPTTTTRNLYALVLIPEGRLSRIWKSHPQLVQPTARLSNFSSGGAGTLSHPCA